ncbi:hypothetical protein [Metallibacterium scheffleri]|uniref:Uncharacterized protein n=1 Tax=Metallibacterium scheffleri TaxID=993689 RepID=A0A4S3KQT8_9GAMM|nr:hypothetical protein [Metallibacterium scheffleri]THD11300.1 hypothetical protein B1806_04055 [Metallibacterium scheffleri]
MDIAEIIIAGAFIVPAVIGGIVYVVTTRKLEAHGLSWDGSSTSRSTTSMGYANWFDSNDDSDDETGMLVNPATGAPMVQGALVDVHGKPFGIC